MPEKCQFFSVLYKNVCFLVYRLKKEFLGMNKTFLLKIYRIV